MCKGPEVRADSMHLSDLKKGTVARVVCRGQRMRLPWKVGPKPLDQGRLVGLVRLSSLSVASWG